jgi:Pyruvate/2-oxoacid:ferredoxin oxidoreductase delta subunit
MCEFCTKHGEGKIWYRNAANYANDLMSDLRRRTYIKDFLSSVFGDGFKTLGRLETIFTKKGRLPQNVKTAMINRAKEEHFGQVLPIEEISDLVMKAETVVRMPCACRWNIGRKEERCCYAVSYGPDAWYKDIDMSYFGKPSDQGLESVKPEEAIQQMKDLEEGGAIHTIWTMMTPFIGAVCNCSPEDCLAMRTLNRIHVETMARAEYVARIDDAVCDGCGLCDINCHFQAIDRVSSSGRQIARIDPGRCFGCGLCRNACGQEAISLNLRSSDLNEHAIHAAQYKDGHEK